MMQNKHVKGANSTVKPLSAESSSLVARPNLYSDTAMNAI